MKKRSFKKNPIRQTSLAPTVTVGIESNEISPAKKLPTLPLALSETETETPLFLRSEKKTKFKYSIVSAVYNIARYLDAYFESITNQTVNFCESIEIILVDDGSIDDSSELIKKWVALYPKNIRYLYQENAGQGAARNLGLRYAKHEWVTFIDADDFIALNYFEEIDASISANEDHQPLKMVSANYIYYFEDTEKVADSHPLRFRFAKGDSILPAANLGKHIILNVNCAFFKRNRLIEQNIQFNPEIKPGFEDAHFVNLYLLGLDSGFVAFLKAPEYFYRKREDGTSTLDTAWEHPERYEKQLRLGVLGIIKESIRKHGHVKEFIQRTALYDLSWHFKRLINNETKLSFLTAIQKTAYESLIREIMEYISEETIIAFELAGIWFYHKVGLLSLYKTKQPDFSIVYVDEVDYIKDLVKLRYFTNDPKSSERYSWDRKPTIPVYSTVRRHNFLEHTFTFERIVWLRIGDVNRLEVTVSNIPTRISLRGKQHHKGLATRDIYSGFKNNLVENDTFPQEVRELRQESRQPETVLKYANCWLLMDRDTQADDNAEHLYRYLKINQPNIRIFFILNQNSPDWSRLDDENFQLIPFGSDEHKLALLNASHLISSHADHYIFCGLEKKWFSDLLTYRYTFLQHGITKDDISSWLNSKNIDCFVTATHPEFKSITDDGPYKFTQKEVSLTGFARHDSLRALDGNAEKIILIMPTWRNSLVGPSTGAGNERELNPNFAETQYAQCWRSVLHSEDLKQLAENHDYKIIFFPHANIQPYLSTFNVPEHINIQGHTAGESIQLQFSRAGIVLTDYSSIAFESAALCRSIVYFQFDALEIFSGGHFYRPGYYDYSRDGFGPICDNLQDVTQAIGEILDNDGKPSSLYLKRMQDTFAFGDSNNCKRIYEAIDSLEQSTIRVESSRPAALEYARRAMNQHDWKEALLAWSQAKVENTDFAAEAAFECAIACRQLDRLSDASEWLTLASANGYDLPKVQEQQLLLAIESRDFTSANHLSSIFDAGTPDIKLDDSTLALLVRANRIQNNFNKASLLLSHAKNPDQPDIKKERAQIASQLEMWPEAYELWKSTVLDNKFDDDHYLLLFAQACRKNKFSSEAATVIARIKNSANTPGYYNESAEIAFSNSHWRNAEKAWSQISNDGGLSPDISLKLARARRKIGDLTGANKAFCDAEGANDERTYLQEKALLLSALGNHTEEIHAWVEFLSRKDLSPNRDAWLHLASARFKSGDAIQAKKDVDKFESFSQASKKSLELRKTIESALKVKKTS